MPSVYSLARQNANDSDTLKNHANRIQNEFFFFCFMKELSAAIHKEDGRKLRMSEVRLIRKELCDTPEIFDFNTKGSRTLVKKLNSVIGMRFPNTDCRISEQSRREADERLKTIKAEYSVPLSPFDDRFFGFRWTLQGESVYAPTRAGADLLKKTLSAESDIPTDAFCEDDYSLDVPRSTWKLMGVPCFTDTVKSIVGRLPESCVLPKRYYVGAAECLNDAYGLSMLSLYLPKDNPVSMKRLADHVIAGGDPMSRKALGNMCALLDYLLELGKEYTVRPDREKGQLRAYCDKTSFRIMDLGRNEAHIGRAYCDGVAYELTLNTPLPAYEIERDRYRRDENGKRIPIMVEKDGKFKQGEEHCYYPVPEDIRMVVDYLFGGRNDSIEHTKTKYMLQTFLIRPLRMIEPAVCLEDKQVPPDYEGDPATYPDGSFYGKDRYMRLYVQLQISVFRKRPAKKNEEVSLEKAISSARANFVSAIEIDRLAREAEENADDADYVPLFSADELLSRLQQSCWDKLCDARRKEGDRFDAEKAIAALTEQAKTHISDQFIGSLETCFDPVLTARFMTSSSVLSRTREQLAAELLRRGIEDRFKGDARGIDEFTEMMIGFREDKAENLREKADDSDFWKRIYDAVIAAVESAGCKPDKVEADDRGLIRYSFKKQVKSREYSQTGYIGQVFEPLTESYLSDATVVPTRFNKSNNYLYVPGYHGIIIPPKDGDLSSYEERTRLIGYREMLVKAITSQIRSDIIKGESERILSRTKLNRIYGMQYGERYPVDKLEGFTKGRDGEYRNEEHLKREDFVTILRTLSRRVRFDNIYRDYASIKRTLDHGDSEAVYDCDLDRWDPFVRTGFENFVILKNNGYFSPTATSTANTQGLVRYLSDGAEIAPDGRIVRAEKNGGNEAEYETALIKRIPKREYDTVDRVQMVFSHLLKCRSVAENIGIVFTNLGQFNQNDGVVVSKRFADSHMIYGKAREDYDADDGDEEIAVKTKELRPLQIGDKLCDMHGNKFTISLVVDPSENLKQDEKLEKAILFFRNNPSADVVASPYSFISRFNAGSAREIMENVKKPRSIRIEGREIPGALGFIQMIITDHAVDKKLNLYETNGRSFNPQLTAACIAASAEDVIREVKGKDKRAFDRAHEMLLPLGIVLSRDGTLSFDLEGEVSCRSIIRQPQITVEKNAENSESVADLTERFMREISRRGGWMELPFALSLPSGAEESETAGEASEEADDEDENAVASEKAPSLPASFDENGKPNGMFLLPLMPPDLREGIESYDGTTTSHQYTHHYEKIFQNSIRYRLSGDDEQRSWFQHAAQAEYDRITYDLIRRIFDRKHGMFKNMMARRLNDSATSVWVANPRLKLNEISMSNEMSQQLKASMRNSVLLWRDPILSDGGVRHLKVVIDGSYQNAIGIHPAITKSFKGDFDGDSVGVWKPRSAAAARLSVQENLADESFVTNDKEGKYRFYIDDELDMQAVLYQDRKLSEEYSALRVRLNALLPKKDSEDPEIHAAYLKERDALFEELNELCDKIQKKAYGINTIRFDSAARFAESVCECAENKAKGSYDKAEKLFDQFGMTVKNEKDADGKTFGIDFADITVDPYTHATDQQREDTMFATASKTMYTGMAGKVLQNGLLYLLDGEYDGVRYAKAVMELTAAVTQSLLQIKHDPIRAQKLVRYLDKGVVGALWDGFGIEKREDEWRVSRNGGKRVRLSPDEWEKEFIAFYTDKDGLDVVLNPRYVGVIAHAMTKKKGENSVIAGVKSLRGLSTVLSSELTYQAFNPSFRSLTDHIRRYEPLNLYGILYDEDGKILEDKSSIARVYAPRSLTKDREEEKVIPAFLKGLLAKISKNDGLFRDIDEPIDPSGS